MYLKDRTNFFKAELKVLHFAPEFCLQRVFKSLSNLEYVSADLDSALATVQTDITRLSFRDDIFDCILSIHVLEHIPNDQKAMAELYRVLKPSGWAILQVPIRKERTLEGNIINTPEQRLKHFGQEDHVRIYGSDYKERLDKAGFRVEVNSYSSQLSEARVSRYRPIPENESGEDIYLCYKPGNS
jgi:ubiquinone/menaquinone biosynthesis C-methylase UbiE